MTRSQKSGVRSQKSGVRSQKGGGVTVRLTSRVGLSRMFGRLRWFCRTHAIAKDVERDLHLALDEIVTNILEHGRAATGGRRGAVRITVGVALIGRGRAVQVTVTDTAAAFNPLTRADPRVDVPVAERPVGGLGILFVKRLMDRMTYSRRNGFNEIVLTRRAG